MFSAKGLRASCPQCRAQVLKFYESDFASLFPRSQLVQLPKVPSSRTAFRRLNSVAASGRNFSTALNRRQEVQPEPSSTKLDDIETIVRQARQTFGNTLPSGYLSKEEYKVYERLYGAPLRETRPEDVAVTAESVEGLQYEDDSLDGPAPLGELRPGNFAAIEYLKSIVAAEEAKAIVAEDKDVEAEAELTEPDLTDSQLEYFSATANNQREYDMLLKLQKDFEAASLRPLEDPEEEMDPDEEDEYEQEEEEDEDDPDAVLDADGTRQPGAERLHPYTREGQFRTSPSTLQLPQKHFIEPITTLLGRADAKHVQEAAEKAFGGPGFPHSPATLESKKNLPMKPIGMEAGHHRMSEIDADAYLATVMPGVYSSAMSALVEVRKRLGTEWMRGLLQRGDGQGPRVLDAGAAGAGLAAWQEVMHADWRAAKERGEVSGPVPQGKKTVIVGSDNLRHRISRFLHDTQFLPRLPDYLHSTEGQVPRLDGSESPQPRKTYDIIIATHLLMPLDKPYKRKALIDNLWSMLAPDGGILIVLEKGHPRGFEAVADVRQRMLDEFIIPPVEVDSAIAANESTAEEIHAVPPPREREPGMIVAPCTNHTKCPMYLTPGLSHGRKDFCHFQQRFNRPPFLQRLLGASHHNHEDIRFSYLAVRRGAHPAESPAAAMSGHLYQGDKAAERAFAGYGQEAGEADSDPNAAAPHPLSLPRTLLAPLKRRKHVTLDVCTPAGHIERWTVPKSFGRQAYHDARKARWGDLWALGAKTRVRREVRLGRGGGEGTTISAGAAGGDTSATGVVDAAVRQPRAARGRGKGRDDGADGKRKKLRVIELSVDPEMGGVVGARERRPLERERRDKRGKKAHMKDLLKELEDEEDV